MPTQLRLKIQNRLSITSCLVSPQLIVQLQPNTLSTAHVDSLLFMQLFWGILSVEAIATPPSPYLRLMYLLNG